MLIVDSAVSKGRLLLKPGCVSGGLAVAIMLCVAMRWI